MLAWWEAMTLVEQIFAVVGIASTVLLVIEVILLLIGAGHGGDADVGADAPGDVLIRRGRFIPVSRAVRILTYPGIWICRRIWIFTLAASRRTAYPM